MTRLIWDKMADRRYETGVDHGVLYLPNQQGVYDSGVVWNGLTAVTESPSGAEASAQYADNIKYLNLVSAEEFGGTIEAFTYPFEFGVCDGTAELAPGISIGQQNRSAFGFAYRTKIGNALTSELGYKLHLVYGALAAPTERAYATVNDSPEALAFSWEFSTTPIEVPGQKPTAILTIDSTRVDADALQELEDILYGTPGTDPRLPTPAEVAAIFVNTSTEVDPSAPTYNAATKVITIPTVTGVVYSINGEPVSGTVTITENTVVTAAPAPGYKFPAVTDDDWLFKF